MNFSGLIEYKKEYRKLSKKYLTLQKDLKNFRYVISSEIPVNTRRFTILTENETCQIIKARLACKYLKNSTSVLRIVFACYKQVKRIEFIEIYSKADKNREDRARIDEYLELLQVDPS